MFNLTLATILSRVIILIIAFSIHEFAHAWTANSFGDSTPKINITAITDNLDIAYSTFISFEFTEELFGEQNEKLDHLNINCTYIDDCNFYLVT